MEIACPEPEMIGVPRDATRLLFAFVHDNMTDAQAA
jgi:hypothetical protein